MDMALTFLIMAMSIMEVDRRFHGGRGHIRCFNGNYYEGTFNDGKLNGKGTFRSSIGGYTGEWVGGR